MTRPIKSGLETGVAFANTLDDFKEIRAMYNYLYPEIIKRRYIHPNSGLGCSFTGHYYPEWKMSPLEEMVWQDIRFWGLPLYPQYPVLNFFVDFGSPVFKVAVEVDGKIYHTDAGKDIERQNKIEKQGWKVFRIIAREIYDSEQTIDALNEVSKICFGCPLKEEKEGYYG